jgi:predicted RNase H-like HicB family nuclease
MRFFTFEVVIERRGGEAEYAAYSPTLTGCFARGATIEEARRNVHDAIRRRLEALLAGGEPVVQADDLRYVEQLTIGVPS